MKKQFANILDKKHTSLHLNIIFAAYIYFLSPIISSTLTIGKEGNYFNENYLLGTILILAILADTLLYPLKLKIVLANLEEELSENMQIVIFFIAIFRINVTYGMLYVIFNSFGYEAYFEGELNPYFTILVIIGSMKDLVYGIMPAMMSSSSSLKYLRPYAYEKYVDLALMLFIAIMFTVVSNMFKFENPIFEGESLLLKLLFPLVAMLMLPFVYWPSRIPYLIEDFVYANTWKRKLLFFISNYAIMLSIFYN